MIYLPGVPAAACPPLTDRTTVHISSFDLDIPKVFVIGLRVDDKEKSRLLIGLAVPLDCLGLKLMAPYNTGKVREILAITLRINDVDETQRVAGRRKYFGEQSGSFDGYRVYRGYSGQDLYVASDASKRPLLAFCDNNPLVVGPDTPRPCDVEEDEANNIDGRHNKDILTAQYTLLQKDFSVIYEIDEKVRVLIRRMMTGI